MQLSHNDIEIKKFFPHSLRSATLSSEKLGHHEDVVKFGREAVVLYRSLVHDRPDENWRFADCLRSLGPSLAIVGFVDEAIQVAHELKRIERKVKEVDR